MLCYASLVPPPPPQMALLSEVYTVASLIIVMPATNAVSERSFSALRHLKTF